MVILDAHSIVAYEGLLAVLMVFARMVCNKYLFQLIVDWGLLVYRADLDPAISLGLGSILMIYNPLSFDGHGFTESHYVIENGENKNKFVRHTQ